MTDWSRLVRPSLHGLEPYRPGASLRELKALHDLDDVVKLNWNEDLFGPLPGALEAVEAELGNVWMYPEQAYGDLREAVAGWLGVPTDWIVPAHGIQALVVTVAHAFLREGDRVVIPTPTYGLYAQVCAAVGAEVVRVPLGDGLGLDLDATIDSVRRHGAQARLGLRPEQPDGIDCGARRVAHVRRRAARGNGRDRRRGVPRVRRARPARPP